MDNQQVRNTRSNWKTIEFATRYKINEYGEVYSLISNKILKTTMVGKYHRVSIVDDLGKDKAYLIHRLVALTFLENPHNKAEVNHKDGNPNNNHISNLEWVTREENQKHAFSSGLNTNKGVNNGRALLTPEKVVEIYKYMLNGATSKQASLLYGYDVSTIRNIRIKKNWKEYLEDLPDIAIRKNNKPLTKEQVELIKDLRKNESLTCKKISDLLGISLGQVEGVFRTRSTKGV